MHNMVYALRDTNLPARTFYDRHPCPLYHNRDAICLLNLSDEPFKIHISDGIHAVCDTSRRLISFAFFEAGKYRNDDIVVETDKPCLLEIGRTGKGKYIARISSPEQIHKEITVRITTDDGEKTFTAGFPVNDTRYAGRTLEYDLNFDK